MAEIVNRAVRARDLVSAALPEGACISLPIPVQLDDVLVDGFFTFTISYLTMQPYPSRDCLLVLPDGQVIVDSMRFALDGIPFDASHDVMPADWEGAYARAYACYDAAFDELAAGEPGGACAQYVRAVQEATLASQLPYYRALCPRLFGTGAESSARKNESK